MKRIGDMAPYAGAELDEHDEAELSIVGSLGSRRFTFAKLWRSIVQWFGYYNVKSYGAKLDGVTDDTTAIQACFAAAGAATLLRTMNVDLPHDVGGASYSAPRIKFPQGAAIISNAITVTGSVRIEGHDTVIKQTHADRDIFVSASVGVYNCSIAGIHFVGGTRQIALDNGNVDTSMCLIEDCTFSDTGLLGFAVQLTLRSAQTVIRRCRVLSAPQWLKMTDCDGVIIEQSYIQGFDRVSLQKPADTCSILAMAQNGVNQRLTIRECLFVPEPGPAASNALTRWIDLHDYIDLQIIHCQFGGENAGFPIIYNYSSLAAVAGYPYTQCGGITIVDSEITAGALARADAGVVVLKTAVPHKIHIAGDSLVYGFIINDQISGGAAAWMAAHTDATHPQLSVMVEGMIGFGWTFSNTTALDAYAHIWQTGWGGAPNILKVPSLRAAKVNTTSGVTADTASNTYVTLFTPTVAGRYELCIVIPGSGTAFQGIAQVTYDGTATVLQSKTVGASCDFQLSGNAVQAKQVSGVSSTMSWSYLLISIA